jgi:cobalt-zinc-cadmium efflux system protein
MLVFAVVGLAANLAAIALLASRREESLNMRGAFLEVVGDAVGSLVAIVAGLVIVTTGFDRADPIGSLVIAVLLLPRAWALLRDCLHVLLESVPPGVDMEAVRRHLVGAEGAVDVHDLHVWSITSGMPALSAHVTVTNEALETRGVGRILDELGECVATHFGIDHATFQVEPESHREHEPGDAHR